MSLPPTEGRIITDRAHAGAASTPRQLRPPGRARPRASGRDDPRPGRHALRHHSDHCAALRRQRAGAPQIDRSEPGLLRPARLRPEPLTRRPPGSLNGGGSPQRRGALKPRPERTENTSRGCDARAVPPSRSTRSCHRRAGCAAPFCARIPKFVQGRGGCSRNGAAEPCVVGRRCLAGGRCSGSSRPDFPPPGLDRCAMLRRSWKAVSVWRRSVRPRRPRPARVHRSARR